ncbi:hypothetical protein CGH27_26535, partial [Vibrio parahaemolyticus]
MKRQGGFTLIELVVVI